MQRKKEREIIILALYNLDLTGHTIKEALDFLQEQLKFDEVTPYITERLDGVIETREELDSIITRNLSHYTIDRLSYIDRQILRFATYEMNLKDPELHPVVIINEAVELCKRYSDLEDQKASSFLNSVLDKIKSDLYE